MRRAASATLILHSASSIFVIADSVTFEGFSTSRCVEGLGFNFWDKFYRVDVWFIR